VINDLAFSNLARGALAGEGDVTVHGVVAEVFGEEVAHAGRKLFEVKNANAQAPRRSDWQCSSHARPAEPLLASDVAKTLRDEKGVMKPPLKGRRAAG
jgi:hypothetical protein